MRETISICFCPLMKHIIVLIQYNIVVVTVYAGHGNLMFNGQNIHKLYSFLIFMTKRLLVAFYLFAKLFPLLFLHLFCSCNMFPVVCRLTDFMGGKPALMLLLSRL